MKSDAHRYLRVLLVFVENSCFPEVQQKLAKIGLNYFFAKIPLKIPSKILDFCMKVEDKD